MRWFDKRYRTFNYEMRERFGEKMFKLSLDGGFTCPNRDGKISRRGCLFCSEKGSGEHAGDRSDSISKQIESQIELLSEKWTNGKYIAYFQNFTNTYSQIDDLKAKYESAIKREDVLGLAIGTRADCLEDEVIELLSSISSRKHLWVEIGLQTVHDRSAAFLRRGYDFDVFLDSLERLRSKNINVVAHLILGIPGESKADMIETVKTVSKLDIQGVKLHLLHVVSDCDLNEYYEKQGFEIFEKDNYISTVCDCIELLNPQITIHRLTGDGSKDTLVAPRWSLDKRSVLNGIDRELKERDSYQGIYFK